MLTREGQGEDVKINGHRGTIQYIHTLNTPTHRILTPFFDLPSAREYVNGWSHTYAHYFICARVIYVPFISLT